MLELLKERRSIRKYTKNRVEKDRVDQLVRAALLSPSSRGICPWELIVIEEGDMIRKLARAKEHGSAFLTNAPLAIIVIGDPDKSDVWIEDVSILSTIIHLTAHSLGLGSCWIQIRKRQHNQHITADQYIKNILQIPANKQIESIIALGYPAEEKPAYDDKDLKREKVYADHYGQRYF